ncbi:ATP-binding protein [Kitasatospora purpeofusca]|uniref:ATP-binding protein n=1 Tax=Kitasatospora purpeofusca TaxID=67352 RepID=UPI0035DAE79D
MLLRTGAMHMVAVEQSRQCLRRWQATFAATLADVPDARRRVRSALQQWGCQEGEVDDVVSICSELVANAIRHGSRPHDCVDLTLRQDSWSVRVEVVDRRPDLLLPPAPATQDESGRGLTIVTALADRVGTTTTSTTKTVWARLALTTDRTRNPS